MLKYPLILSLALAVALPHENTLGQRIGIATFGLIDGGTFVEIGQRLSATFSVAASALNSDKEK